MQAIRTDETTVTVELSVDELEMLNNALNEVCHGVGIPAFETRMGFDKATVKDLLDRVHEVVVRMRSPQTR